MCLHCVNTLMDICLIHIPKSNKSDYYQSINDDKCSPSNKIVSFKSKFVMTYIIIVIMDCISNTLCSIHSKYLRKKIIIL